MKEPEYEEIRLPDKGGEFTEAGFKRTDHNIWVTVEGDRYHCFWYTDCEANNFFTALQSEASIPDMTSVTVSLEGGSDQINPLLTEAREVIETQSVTALELTHDRVTYLWVAHEQVERDRSHKIQITAPVDHLQPIQILYSETAPTDADDSAKNSIINDVIEYLKRGRKGTLIYQ